MMCRRMGRTTWTPRLAASIAAAVFSGSVLADPLEGTWQTPPDGKGVSAQIEVKTCAPSGVCGVIARTYDSDGRRVHTRNLGVRIFWEMLPAGSNAWKGWAYVPLYKKTLKGQITMQDAKNIKVGGCLGPVCKSQKWSRVW